MRKPRFDLALCLSNDYDTARKSRLSGSVEGRSMMRDGSAGTLKFAHARAEDLVRAAMARHWDGYADLPWKTRVSAETFFHPGARSLLEDLPEFRRLSATVQRDLR